MVILSRCFWTDFWRLSWFRAPVIIPHTGLLVSHDSLSFYCVFLLLFFLLLLLLFHLIYSCQSISCKKTSYGKTGVEASIHANYVPIYVVKPIGVDAKNSKWVWSGNTTITNRRQPRGTARKSHSTKSENVPMTYDPELGQRSTGWTITIYLTKRSFPCYVLRIKHCSTRKCKRSR